ncbi:MarR family winged helix-turn-helix transcriptional regulator [Roseimaritima ulvae]|uniref:Organic hydroperoxide resistance transcriptional regulator n=1 Tax=Roseimaritima ulvae TaxID=980254 RepID=A0A5B9R1Y4_9BACT|nr:MarR family transcriptional regulator [Roseimaritima ulvae]QEG43825.1 Organic hydroperoxide resistance transcriptional regulator [Roseimaritima ulvae]
MNRSKNSSPRNTDSNSNSLYQELHRCQPFAGTAQEAVLSVLRTGDQLDTRLRRFFRQFDLTLPQYNVLRMLDMEDRPLTCGEIGERLVQIVPGVTAMVDRLLKRGLVTRTRSETDRRTVYIAITKAGRKLVSPTVDPLRKLEHEIMSGLRKKDQQELIRLLQIVRQSLTESEVDGRDESLTSSGL